MADNPAGAELMFAECDFVQRVEKPDGSSVETQQCHLTEAFFVFPGTTPESALTNTAGTCTWFSDYTLQTGGESYAAELCGGCLPAERSMTVVGGQYFNRY